MRRFRLHIALLVGLVILCSCSKEYDPDPVFVSGDTICLKVEGAVIHTYITGSWQASFRAGLIQYRIFSDDNRNFYKLDCSKKPESEGQEIIADISWRTESSQSVQTREGVHLRVQRIDAATGTVSLWSSKSNIGISVIQTD